MLYIRTGVMMVITFYTTRVLLQQLGVQDYGIYDVLMGVITLFAFVSGSLTTATQRFVSAALGEGGGEKVTQVFAASLYMYMLMVTISVVLFETLGLWYIDNYINVPVERFIAAKIVYQLVVLQFVFLTFRIPYNSAVIAYERMDFYAYISIVEAVLALGLVYVLSISKTDKLILYVALLVVSRLIVLCSYVLYCRRYIKSCCLIHFNKIPKESFLQIWSFSGWNIFGSFANTANQYGVNLIVNLFCGVTVNATIGIANQLTMGMYTLVGNLQTAFNPQIIKLYAAKEYDSFKALLHRNSKFCFFLYLLLLIPFYICVADILQLWLGRIPVYSISLCRCMLVYLAIESIAYPLTIAIQADGNISRYQQIAGFIFLAFVPLSYLLFSWEFGVIFVFIARIIQNMIIMSYRLFYLHRIMSFNVGEYIQKVVFVCIVVMLLSFILPWIVYELMNDGWPRMIFVMIIAFFATSLIVFYVGLSVSERHTTYKYIMKSIKRKAYK